MRNNLVADSSFTVTMSYRQIFYHIVFGTKFRIPAIDSNHEHELYKYIWGIIKNKRCVLYRINGMEEHVHILSDLHPSVSLADYIKDIEVASSLWMKQTGRFPSFRGWADGYGAFTCSIREKERITNYIKNQKAHHKTEAFPNEYKRLLAENHVAFNEKYST